MKKCIELEEFDRVVGAVRAGEENLGPVYGDLAEAYARGHGYNLFWGKNADGNAEQQFGVSKLQAQALVQCRHLQRTIELVRDVPMVQADFCLPDGTIVPDAPGVFVVGHPVNVKYQCPLVASVCDDNDYQNVLMGQYAPVEESAEWRTPLGDILGGLIEEEV